MKEEGLEPKILKILKKNNVRKYFFHDQTFSSLIKNMHKTKVSIRYSEFEELKKLINYLIQSNGFGSIILPRLRLIKNFIIILRGKK